MRRERVLKVGQWVLRSGPRLFGEPSPVLWNVTAYEVNEEGGEVFRALASVMPTSGHANALSVVSPNGYARLFAEEDGSDGSATDMAWPVAVGLLVDELASGADVGTPTEPVPVPVETQDPDRWIMVEGNAWESFVALARAIIRLLDEAEADGTHRFPGCWGEVGALARAGALSASVMAHVVGIGDDAAHDYIETRDDFGRVLAIAADNAQRCGNDLDPLSIELHALCEVIADGWTP